MLNPTGTRAVVRDVAEPKERHRRRVAAILAAGLTAATASLLVVVPGAGAANSPTFRDCSFSGGFDPDFVKLTGAKPGPNETLVARPKRKTLTVLASESPDAMDQTHMVSLNVTVKKGNSAPSKLSGSGTGKVSLTVPLAPPRAGKTYTIAWKAMFDNGLHGCPSSVTPQNTSPKPFVVKVKRR